MKHRSLQFVLALGILVSLASPALASEITGSLSSSGNNSPSTQQQTTGTSTQTPQENVSPDNGSLAGNVSGDTTNYSSGGSATRASNGDVLGAKTMAAQQSPNTYSGAQGSTYTSTYVEPSQDLPAANYGNGVSENGMSGEIEPQVLGVSDYRAPKALGTWSEFSAASWFWIIVLSLLLVAVITYIYNGNKEARASRLHF